MNKPKSVIIKAGRLLLMAASNHSVAAHLVPLSEPSWDRYKVDINKRSCSPRGTGSKGVKSGIVLF